jgi:hypothetical protein
MAKKVSVETIDDLDGTSTADTTVNYSIDGTHYEIDLSTKNADKFHKDMATWIDHSRRVSAPAQTRRGRKLNGNPGEDFGAIREWATTQGIATSMRGRIKSEIITAYHNRNNTPAATPVAARASRSRVKAAVASVVPVDSPEFSEAK